MGMGGGGLAVLAWIEWWLIVPPPSPPSHLTKVHRRVPEDDAAAQHGGVSCGGDLGSGQPTGRGARDKRRKGGCNRLNTWAWYTALPLAPARTLAVTHLRLQQHGQVVEQVESLATELLGLHAGWSRRAWGRVNAAHATSHATPPPPHPCRPRTCDEYMYS